MKDDDRQQQLFDLGPRTIPELHVKSKRPLQPVWTKNKSALVSRYLRYFVFITKHGTYIDAMAGPQYHWAPEFWSAKRVLESHPAWMRHFYLFERDDRQVQRLRDMVAEQKRPRNHTIEILHGDSNVLLPALLGRQPIRSKEATFCLLDQRTFECEWSTLDAIARYKPAGHNKIEIFYFLPNWWLARAIAGTTRNIDGIRKWWGRDDWEVLREVGNHARATLFVERFRRELGYASVQPWPIWDRRGGSRIMYYMIHATDHPEAPKLMARAYRMAVEPEETPEQLGLLDWGNLPDEPPLLIDM